MQTHTEDEEKWKEQELESLLDGYLNYHDTVRIILIDYEHVSTKKSLLAYVIYYWKWSINSYIMLYFILA